VEGKTDATAWIKDARYTGKVIHSDTNLDVALIQLDGIHDGLRPLLFAPGAKYQPGENVYTLGFPMADVLGVSPRVSKGLLSASVGLKDDPRHLQISAEIQPGNSGGPLFDEHGEVIGMLNASMNAMQVLLQTGGALPQNINFAIKSQAIGEFLKSAKVELPMDAKPILSSDLSSANDSVVLVRSGIVTEEDLKAPGLVCACHYLYSRDQLIPQIQTLRAIRLVFYDTHTGKELLSATGTKADFARQDYLLDEMFQQIFDKLFPGRPNPFKKK
jgi:serine protease Do